MPGKKKRKPQDQKQLSKTRRSYSQTVSSTFPIVAIGASAGGLEAFSKLLRALPQEPGLALVFIPHLDPTHESAMVELLSRTTALPVHQAKQHAHAGVRASRHRRAQKQKPDDSRLDDSHWPTSLCK